ncbi:MAG: hypothetical protein JWN41_270, partial [Thermoleophilia bacterium]|nr:hypothetical protein [Thermoleophilia bacterium]
SQRRLIDAVCSWGAAHDSNIVVTFDGAGPYGTGEHRVTPNVVVLGTGASDADDLLEQRSRQLQRAGLAVWLVTDDVALRRVAGAGAERVTSSAEFLALVARAPAHELVHLDEGGTPHTRVGDRIDASTRARLERLRRGEH